MYIFYYYYYYYYLRPRPAEREKGTRGLYVVILTTYKLSKPQFEVQFKKIKFDFIKSYSGLYFFEEKIIFDIKTKKKSLVFIKIGFNV